MILNIQMVRAAAALLVVICHSAYTVAPIWPSSAPFMTALGFTGVDLFFVVSGFVVTKVGGIAPLGAVRARAFLVKRVLRIYPIYWVAFAVTLAASLFFPVLRQLGEGKSIALSFFLLTPNNSTISVGWTLAYEMYFYILVALVIAIGRNFWGYMSTLAAVYIFAIVVWQLAFGTSIFFLNPIIIDFFLGFAVASLCRGRVGETFVFSSVLVAVGVALLALGTHQMSLDDPWKHSGLRPYYLGFPSAILLFGLVRMEQYWRAPNFLAKFGDASYSIYLWHFQFIVTIGIWATGAFMWRYPLSNLVVTVMVSIAIGILSFKFIEKPLSRLFLRRVPQARLLPTPVTS